MHSFKAEGLCGILYLVDGMIKVEGSVAAMVSTPQDRQSSSLTHDHDLEGCNVGRSYCARNYLVYKHQQLMACPGVRYFNLPT